MFTFSFGSAFAAIPADDTLVSADQARAKVEAEYKAAVAALDAAMAAAVSTAFPGTSTTNDTILAAANTASSADVVVDRAVVEKVLKEEVYDAQKAKIDVAYDQVCREIEGMIANPAFVAFTTATADGAAYPKLDMAKYDYVALNDYASGVTNPVNSAASFEIGTTGDGADDGLEATLAIAQYKAVLAAAEEFITAINVNDYSTQLYAATEDTHREVAQKLVNLALRTLGDLVAPTTVDTAATQIGEVNDVYTEAVGADTPKGGLFRAKKADDSTPYTEFAPGLNALLKVAKENTAAENLKYAQTETLNYVTSVLTADKNNAVKAINELIRTENAKAKPSATVLTELSEGLADVNDAFDAALETYTYIIENAKTVEALGSINSTTNIFTAAWTYTAGAADVATYKAAATGADIYALVKEAKIVTTATANEIKQPSGAALTTLKVSDCEARALLVDAAEEAAAADKVNVALDGAKAIEIEEALEDAIYDCYFKGDNTYTTVTDLTVLQLTKADLIGNATATVKVNGKTYDTILKWRANAGSTATAGASYPYDSTSVTSNYDAYMFDEIRVIADETKDAVNAAETVADAEAAFLAGYAKFDAVPTASEHAAMFNKSGALYTDYQKYIASVKQLATGIEAVHDAKKLAWVTGTILSGAADSFYSEVVAALQECFTAEEMKAVYDEAVAKLNSLKTVDDLKAEKAEVEKTITALPKVVTVADKAAVEAARAAYDAYQDYVDEMHMTGYDVASASNTILTNAEKAIFDLELEALNDAFKPLAKKLIADTLTADDAAAVKEMRAQVKAFVDYYKYEDDDNVRIAKLESLVTYGGKVLTEVEAKMVANAKDALKEAIAKLAVDNVDAAAVKAAREAFNALSPADQLAFKTDAATKAAYDKLVALEKLIVMDDEAVKAYVQDLSIKARSTKTSKGVKVTIKADVQPLLDAGYTVEYKFYRSTKSNKNFGKAMITKTTGTYTNTKGVKGTKYYYKAKLVVKNAEGEVVATTPLTQCLYATRTF